MHNPETISLQGLPPSPRLHPIQPPTEIPFRWDVAGGVYTIFAAIAIAAGIPVYFAAGLGPSLICGLIGYDALNNERVPTPAPTPETGLRLTRRYT